MEGMVRIPGASFLLGSPTWVLDWLDQQGQAFPRAWFTDETPQRAVDLKAFWVDRYPVTVRQFAEFVNETGYRTDAERLGSGMVYTERYWEMLSGACWKYPGGAGSNVDGRENHPVVHISWDDARAYARWVGKRLPTEAEWELTARGVDYRLWPWGDSWQADCANTAEFQAAEALSTLGSWQDWWQSVLLRVGPVPQTTPVGAFSPSGDSIYGVSDLAGNVYEWTATLSDFYGDPGECDLLIKQVMGTYRVIRGGSWMNFRYQIRCSERMHGDPFGWSNFATGFRCVRDA